MKVFCYLYIVLGKVHKRSWRVDELGATSPYPPSKGEFSRLIYNGVIRVSVVGLTTLSHYLLRRRFLLRRNDKFKFKGKFKDKVLLAWRANAIVIWNAARLK